MHRCGWNGVVHSWCLKLRLTWGSRLVGGMRPFLPGPPLEVALGSDACPADGSAAAALDHPPTLLGLAHTLPRTGPPPSRDWGAYSQLSLPPAPPPARFSKDFTGECVDFASMILFFCDASAGDGPTPGGVDICSASWSRNIGVGWGSPIQLVRYTRSQEVCEICQILIYECCTIWVQNMIGCGQLEGPLVMFYYKLVAGAVGRLPL